MNSPRIDQMTLEEQYALIIKTPAEMAPQEPLFDEPRVGRIVDSYTTYSVCEEPVDMA